MADQFDVHQSRQAVLGLLLGDYEGQKREDAQRVATCYFYGPRDSPLLQREYLHLE